MSHHKEIIILQLRNEAFHRAIIHCYDLAAIDANGIMFMLIAVKLIYCHIAVHYCCFNYDVIL